MTFSGLEQSLPSSRSVLNGRCATILLSLSIVYVCAAMINAPEMSAIARGIVFPLKLFLVASAPTIGGVAFLWADKAITNERRRRLTRMLFVLLWALAAVSLVSLLTW